MKSVPVACKGRFSKKSRVLVEVAALLLVTATQSVASTDSNSSWSNRPSWSNSNNDNNNNGDNPAPQSRRKVDSRYNLAPFSPGSNNLAIDVGQVFLMGDLGNKYADSIGAQLHYTYGVSDLFGFDSSFGYSGHSDGAFSMTSLLTGLRTNLAWYDKVVPYFVFGLGFYRPSYNLATTTIAPVLFGIHAGPGVDLELTKQLFFGAALTFHDAFGGMQQAPIGTTPAGIDVGGTYTSFLLHAGYTF